MFKAEKLFLQVLSPPSAANMDYADADYKDLYDYGPVSYKQANKEAKEARDAKANKSN